MLDPKILGMYLWRGFLGFLTKPVFGFFRPRPVGPRHLETIPCFLLDSIMPQNVSVGGVIEHLLKKLKTSI